MYGNSRNNNPKNGKRKKSASPIRVVIRCSWSGARLTVPTEPTPILAKLTLLEIVLRLESALPPSLFLQNDQESSATLVCLRKLVPQYEWGTTTLKQMLDGDDGSAGVVLTLDMGGYGTTNNNPVKTAISTAASSLNIKPVVVVPPVAMQIDGRSTAPEPPAVAPTSYHPEPMEMDTTPLTDNPHDNNAETNTKVMMPDEAWKNILQSNFDATTKDCLNTLLKIVDNILSRPNEPKVRSIRCANAAFEKKVGRCKGGFEFLYSIGFTPTFPAIGFGGGGGMHQSTAGRQPEMLELTPENESRETLLRGRKVLIDSAVRDLGMNENDLPSVPKVQESLPASTLTAPPPASSDSRPNNNSRGPTSQFNVYKAHSHNIQSAAMGAPDPYAEAGMSTTERQLQNLQSKKDRLEREMQDIESDRGLVAYVAGSGPVPMEATSTTAASGGSGTKSDSSLVAARMKRMEEERKKREEGGFTTKAMRDLEKMKKAKVNTVFYYNFLQTVLFVMLMFELNPSLGLFTRSNSCQLSRRHASPRQVPPQRKGIIYPIGYQISISIISCRVFRFRFICSPTPTITH